MTIDIRLPDPPEDFRPPEPPHLPQTQRLDIRFTGSGSEYFRIWLVNLLLTLVTLSLYAPFARARRLQYFYGNTLVGGHALGFHGDPWKMLRGHLVVLVGTVIYLASSQAAPVVAGSVALLFGALWPALWQASMRFRLGNTSWRGLRLRFGGSYRQAYAAMAPAALPGALALLGVVGGAASGELEPGAKMPVLLAVGVTLSTLLMTLGWPWLLTRIKRYQHNHFGLAQEHTACTLQARAFYRLLLSTSLRVLLALVVGVVAVALLGGLGAVMGRGPTGIGRGVAFMVLMMVLTGLAYAGLAIWAQARVTAGLQNLVWNATASPRLRFHSGLAANALAWRQLRNLGLMLVTFGLYRPFAVANVYQLRLEAVSVEAQGDIERWAQPLPADAGGNIGDAAGDLLGVDLGL